MSCGDCQRQDGTVAYHLPEEPDLSQLLDADVFANDGSVLPKPPRDPEGKVLRVNRERGA